MENVQTIAWTIEIATFIVAVLIAWVVWKVSRRAVREKRAREAATRKTRQRAGR